MKRMGTNINPASRVGQSRGDRAFDGVNVALLVLVLLIILYPLYFTLIASFSDPYAVAKGRVLLLPVNPTVEAYQNVLKESRVWIGYRNTILYTVLGTMFNLLLTIPAAYVLSRRNLVGRKFLTTFFLIPMYFTGGLIPTYLQVKNMDLLNKWYTLAIIGGLSIYNLIVTRVYFQTSIPEEIYESARIDGADDFRIFFGIALPLAKSIIAVMTLFYAVARWDNYFNALVYVSKNKFMPLQYMLREILLANKTASAGGSEMDAELAADMARKAYLAEGMKYALIWIASAPLLAAYPFVQKYFVKGVMIGSVKG